MDENDEIISLSELVKHLAVERWLREHSKDFPQKLFEKQEKSGEFKPFNFRDYIYGLLRHDLAEIANRLTVVSDDWTDDTSKHVS